jgi:hypothetical protein
MMTIDDKRGEGGKNAEKLMTPYVKDPYGEVERSRKYGGPELRLEEGADSDI